MPPYPVIPELFRVAITWTTARGVTPANVIHVKAPSLNEGEVATIVDDTLNLSPILLKDVHSGWSIDHYSVTDLSGTSGAVEVPSVHHPVGGGGGQPILMAARVVSFSTSQRGPSGRGRIFLGPTGEDNTDGGDLINPAADCTDAWEDLRAAFDSAGIALHVASYLHANSHVVEHCTARPYVATQRRRLTAGRST